MQGMVSALLVALLVLQVRSEVSTTRDPKDTTKKGVSINMTVGPDNTSGRKPPKRIPVTEEHLRTAFKTPQARTILQRARVQRMSMDSALISYDATAYLRISAGLGFSRIGRDRLIFRHENVTHVQWHRDVGAWIDIKGARTAIPMAPDDEQDEEAADVINDSDMTPVPYFPGQEPLFSFNGSNMVQSQVDERDMVHPLAEGAEAYYTYAVGDSVTFRLPDGKVIELRELHVRPRQAKWNVAVGSLWFDATTGQLARAAYRLAVPMDVWAIVAEEDSTAQDEIPVWVKPLISPMRAQISAIAVEYGLFQGRFWLPRLNTAEGDAQVSFMRVPFKFQQTFRYASVNALDSLPSIKVAVIATPPDSLSPADREKWRDSVREVRRVARRAQRDSINQGLIVDPQRCDSTGIRTVMTRRRDSNLSVAMRIPCDIKVLTHSPELPKSIFDEGEEVFGSKETEALIAEALSMGVQPPFALPGMPGAQKPIVRYGLEYTRFNRIEGLSSAIAVEQKLGAGYTATLLGRIGHADLEPNFEAAVARSNMTRTVTGRVYNRLVPSNDWGNPLSFGSSLSALLFGRDEGFYYRASGGEFEWMKERGAVFTTRFFIERQRTAAVENEWSLGPAFIPNIAARTGQYAGVSTHVMHTRGLNPNDFRVFTDLHLEGATSDSSGAVYGRGALELTLSDAFGGVASAVTLSAGTSAGPLPSQRRYFLGGAHTVRGQRADTAQAGSAYWLGRVEIGRSWSGARPLVFGDIGWTGDRNAMDRIGRPLSGVGVGSSFMDGLIRFDVAKGVYPRKRVRVDMYVEAKF
jgi:hypothetical protein